MTENDQEKRVLQFQVEFQNQVWSENNQAT